MQQFKFLSLTVITLSLILSSCSSNDSSLVDLPDNSYDSLIEEMLCSQAENPCDLIIEDESVTLEGDMVFDKHDLIEALEYGDPEMISKHMAPDGSGYLENDPEAESRNRIVSFWRFVSQTQATDITYRILPSLQDGIGTCYDGWEGAVRDAAQAYNNLGTKIHFREVAPINEADITLGCDDDQFFNTPFDGRMDMYDISSAARAKFAYADRTPGRYISVNNTANNFWKKGLIMHEFAHTLGFKHTKINSGTFVTCGNLAGYTQDPANSLFRNLINRNTFHVTDSRSIRQMWPNSLTKPANGTLTRLSNDWVKFTFKNNFVITKPYTETVMAHLKNGVWQPARKWCDKPDGAGNYTIYYWSPGAFTNGVQHFWMKGVSHGEEVHSDWKYLGGFTI